MVKTPLRGPQLCGVFLPDLTAAKHCRPVAGWQWVVMGAKGLIRVLGDMGWLLARR